MHWWRCRLPAFDHPDEFFDLSFSFIHDEISARLYREARGWLYCCGTQCPNALPFRRAAQAQKQEASA